MNNQTSFLKNSIMVALLVSSMFLCGCGITAKQMKEKLDANWAACDKDLELGIYETFYEYTECGNKGIEDFYTESNYPYMDLINLFTAYRLVIAERYDNGEITESEVRVLFAEIDSRVMAEAERRNNNAAYAAAASAQGAAAIFQGIGILNQSMQPY